MDTTLVVMAAGMGSRFGGLKQIEPLGPNGEIILDFSVYDAVQAGFSKTVFIIKKEIEKEFREAVGKRIEKLTDVDYAFQSLDSLPSGYSVPEGRVKPWGTGHAVLSARSVCHTPFAVINADDFYGKKSYKVLNDYLSAEGKDCMVGFKLGNTLSDNGTVSRGICEAEDGYLKTVVEHTALDKNSGLPEDTIVSMNMWGFGTDIFDILRTDFEEFLKTNDNPLKGEFFLPFVVDRQIRENGKRVKLLTTDEKWYGVTYKEDAATVRTAVREMIDGGLYNGI